MSDGQERILRFRVSVNGGAAVTAGIEEGVLSVTATRVRLPARGRDEHSVSVHGLEGEEHLGWMGLRLKEGDVVTIEVLGPGPADSPKRRRGPRRAT